MAINRQTKNGYDFYVVSSLLQKSLRRGDIVMASRACNELLPLYSNYCWNRLLTVSAEDCADLVTQEIVALWKAWEKFRKSVRDKDDVKGRFFFAKAIVILAKCKHSRDADELNLLVSDRMPVKVFEREIKKIRKVLAVDEQDFRVPKYAYDVHTRQGKRAGKSRDDFLHDEHAELSNATSVFKNIDEMIGWKGWVDPEVEM